MTSGTVYASSVNPTLTFSNTAIEETVSGSGYTISGTTLTDNEDASTEDSNEDFEGAAIKVKSGSSVTFCGEGTLNVQGNAKNGIKGAEESTQTFNGGTYEGNLKGKLLPIREGFS